MIRLPGRRAARATVSGASRIAADPARSRRPRTRAGWFASGLVALVVLGLAAPVGAAVRALPHATGSVTFGTPTATPRFGTGIDFTQPVQASGLRPLRVELLITQPGDLGPRIKEVSGVGDIASATLRYSLTESDQHLFPNTRIAARWRIVDGDGAAFEGPSLSLTYEDTRFDWKTVSGPIVRVHWYAGNDAFGRRALAIGESGVARAEELLGVSETEPVDFFVYAEQDAFYDALGPGTRENVGGLAVTGIRTLFALIRPDQINDDWVGVVIPHELAHLVVDTAVENPYHFLPRWLNEGLAMYLSEGYDAGSRSEVAAAIRNGTIIPLTGLTGLFPTTRSQFSLGYAESISAVDFIVRQYGLAALVKVILAYRTGVTDDEALTLGLGFDSAALDRAWLDDVGASAPAAYGPQPDPPGPLPSGWSSVPERPAPSASPSAAPGSASPAGSVPAGSVPAGSVPAAASPSSAAAASVTPATPTATATAVAAATGALPSATSTPAALPSDDSPARTDQPSMAVALGVVAILLAGLGALIAVRRRAGPLP